MICHVSTHSFQKFYSTILLSWATFLARTTGNCVLSPRTFPIVTLATIFHMNEWSKSKEMLPAHEINFQIFSPRGYKGKQLDRLPCKGEVSELEPQQDQGGKSPFPIPWPDPDNPHTDAI